MHPGPNRPRPPHVGELPGKLGGDSNSSCRCAFGFAVRFLRGGGGFAVVALLGLRNGETKLEQLQSATAQLVESHNGTASGLLGS